MRTGIVVVGIVLLVLGAVLAFVPLVQTASQNVSELTPAAYNVSATFSITGTVPLSISYTASQAVQIMVETCDSITFSSSNAPQCKNPSNATQNGSSGTFSVAVKPGGAFAVAVIGPGTATITVKEGQTTLGDILLILGIVILLVGLVLRKKARPAPAMMAAPSSNDSAAPMGQNPPGS